MKKNYILFFLCAAGLIVIDQITKVAAVSALGSGGKFVVFDGFLRMNYVENRGAAWGMMQGAGMFFIILTFVIMAGVVYFVSRIPKGGRYVPLLIVAMLIFAGGLGNLIDRIALGYVRDFIDFYGVGFPVFNVADVCVSIAVIMLVILLIFVYRDDDYKAFRKKKKYE